MSETIPEDEIIKWENITSENESDPIKEILERGSTKEIKPPRSRGRPRKTTTPVEEIPPVQEVLPSLPAPEENISTANLVSMFKRSKSQSPPKSRRPALRFSSDKQPAESSEEETNPKWIAAVQTYKCFFNEKLRAKHRRNEITWTSKDTPERIIKECKELQTLCSNSDPASTLGSMWVHCMSGVEAIGPIYGLKTEKLGEVAGIVSERDDFQETMRELLIKYPYLRLVVGLGGLPELRLAVITITVINEMHQMNKYKEQIAMNASPDKPIPSSLNTAYSEL